MNVFKIYMVWRFSIFWNYRNSKKQKCTKMVLNGFPPSLSPASAKVSCQGANKLEKIHCWWFSIISENCQKQSLSGGLKKGSLAKKYEKNTKTIAAVFLRGPKRGNPTMTTSTVTARRKGDPQHYVEGFCFLKKYQKTSLILRAFWGPRGPARMRKPSELYVALRMQSIEQIRAQNACFATELFFPST